MILLRLPLPVQNMVSTLTGVGASMPPGMVDAFSLLGFVVYTHELVLYTVAAASLRSLRQDDTIFL